MHFNQQQVNFNPQSQWPGQGTPPINLKRKDKKKKEKKEKKKNKESEYRACILIKDVCYFTMLL